MTQATENAVTKIAAVVGTVTGIKAAPTYPPDKMAYNPFAITYVVRGTLGNGPIGTRMDLWDIAIDVLIPYKVLDQDIQLLTPFLDTVPAKLQAEVSTGGSVFSGAIQTFEGTEISYIPATDYAGIAMRGYRFLMKNVKILVAT